MQIQLVRTTVTIPNNLLRTAQLYAVQHQTTVSRLVRDGLYDQVNELTSGRKKKKSILKLAGSLNLGGKPMSARHELYDDYIIEKMGL